MINLLLGQPGGGKSYEAVAFHVIPAITQGRKVITNLPLQVDMLESYFPGARELLEIRNPVLGQTGVVRPFSEPEHYGDPWRHPDSGAGALYVIDECHLALPRMKTKIEVEEWYSLHRHEGADVLLITQSYGKISKTICDLVQVVYRCKKGTAFGSANRYIRKVQDGIRGEVVNTSMREYEKKYFQFYKSHTRSNDAVQELAANDIVPLWKRWPFKGAAICMVLFACLVTYNLTRDKKPPVVAKPAVQVQEAPKPAADPVQAPDDHQVLPADPQIAAVPRGPGQKMHPYEGLEFHLQATMQGRKTFPDGTVRDYLGGYIGLAQNGQLMRSVNFDDLRQAGYEITFVSPTVVTVAFKGLDLGYVVSDLSKMSLQPGVALSKNGK